MILDKVVLNYMKYDKIDFIINYFFNLDYKLYSWCDVILHTRQM